MEFAIRPYRPEEIPYIIDAHRKVYTEEYNWGDAFLVYVEEVVKNFATGSKHADEGLWVAVIEDKPIGCIMLCHTEEMGVGQLRLFLVEKRARGYGIGKTLSEFLLTQARCLGYEKLILWTADILEDALRQYARMGFVEVERIPNHTWSRDGKTVYEVKMVLTL